MTASAQLANHGYELNSRSGMISLDLPSGTIRPVPGGVTDHHITVIYLGPDVDDEAFAQAQDRAREAADAMPGPLSGTVGGIGSFPPSDGSDGKVPAWAGVVLPGAERLRSSLEDLSASEHPDWKPHVTLAYVEPGGPLPAPVPATPVTFTHLSVHRGGNEAVRFPLGGIGMANPGTISAQYLDLGWRDQPRDSRGRWSRFGGTGEAVHTMRREREGFSVSPRTGQAPASGYMVALEGHTHRYPAEILDDPDKLRRAIDDMLMSEREAFQGGDMYLGGWVEDGKLWLDPSQNVQDRAEAERLGRERDQVGIFDLQNFETIDTGGSGGGRITDHQLANEQGPRSGPGGVLGPARGGAASRGSEDRRRYPDGIAAQVIGLAGQRDARHRQLSSAGTVSAQLDLAVWSDVTPFLARHRLTRNPKGEFQGMGAAVAAKVSKAEAGASGLVQRRSFKTRVATIEARHDKEISDLKQQLPQKPEFSPEVRQILQNDNPGTPSAPRITARALAQGLPAVGDAQIDHRMITAHAANAVRQIARAKAEGSLSAQDAGRLEGAVGSLSKSALAAGRQLQQLQDEARERDARIGRLEQALAQMQARIEAGEKSDAIYRQINDARDKRQDEIAEAQEKLSSRHSTIMGVASSLGNLGVTVGAMMSLPGSAPETPHEWMLAVIPLATAVAQGIWLPVYEAYKERKLKKQVTAGESLAASLANDGDPAVRGQAVRFLTLVLHLAGAPLGQAAELAGWMADDALAAR